jgi:hypothetical protein
MQLFHSSTCHVLIILSSWLKHIKHVTKHMPPPVLVSVCVSRQHAQCWFLALMSSFTGASFLLAARWHEFPITCDSSTKLQLSADYQSIRKIFLLTIYGQTRNFKQPQATLPCLGLYESFFLNNYCKAMEDRRRVEYNHIWWNKWVGTFAELECLLT